jgi:general secretion pathway protein K
MNRDRRGMALIVVLCVLAVLGAITADVARATRLEVALVESVRSRTVARYAAESGVVAEAADIVALLESRPAASDRMIAFRELGTRAAQMGEVDLGGSRFAVAASDLNARIDLNQSDPETLTGLFQQFTSDHQAEIIVASLKSKPLQRVGELALLPGVTDALALALAPYVTVWGDPTVNINSAPEPVLAALPGVGEATARAIIARRAAGEVLTRTPEEQSSTGAHVSFASDPPPAIVVTEPSHVLIIARGWADGSALTHEIQAVFAISGTHLTLEVWQERDL